MYRYAGPCVGAEVPQAKSLWQDSRAEGAGSRGKVKGESDGLRRGGGAASMLLAAAVRVRVMEWAASGVDGSTALPKSVPQERLLGDPPS